MARRRIRVAPAAQSVLKQANIFRPKRSKASDGTIGDKAHRRRSSDHNPDSRGVVLAVDLTHDPKNGMDAHSWIRWRVGKKDRRIKYAISMGQIWEPGTGWRRYNGENPHVTHAHVSIEKSYENDESPWFDGWFNTTTALPQPPQNWAPPPPAPPSPTENATAFLKAIQAAIFFAKADIGINGPVGMGSSREATVRVIQTGLQLRAKATIVSDGKFGPQTAQWVKWVQGTNNLPVTGVVDAKTMDAIFP